MERIEPLETLLETRCLEPLPNPKLTPAHFRVSSEPSDSFECCHNLLGLCGLWEGISLPIEHGVQRFLVLPTQTRDRFLHRRYDIVWALVATKLQRLGGGQAVVLVKSVQGSLITRELCSRVIGEVPECIIEPFRKCISSRVPVEEAWFESDAVFLVSIRQYLPTCLPHPVAFLRIFRFGKRVNACDEMERNPKEDIKVVEFNEADYCDDVVFLRVGACPPLSPVFESPSSPDVPLEEDDEDESDDVVPSLTVVPGAVQTWSTFIDS